MRWFLALVFLRLALGQSGVPVTGSVQDPARAAVGDATVTLKNTGGAVIQAVAADPLGFFRFERVAPGAYEIEARRDGFKPFITRLRVGPRAPAPLKIVLAIADVRQEITVDAAAAQVSTDPTDNLDVVRLDRQSLDNLPIFDQDYIGTMSRFLDSGAIGTGGVTLIVDGVEASSAGVSPSAIQEVKINQNPYSAEFARPGHGRIEIITKPGSAQYHGAFNFLFRDSEFNARDPFSLVRPPEQRRVFEGHLIGPIGRGKTTSFLISIERGEEDAQAVVYAIGPGGPIRENAATPQRSSDFSGRITRQFGKSQTVSLTYEYIDRSARNQGVGGFTLPEAATNWHFREDNLIFSHRTVFSASVVNMFSIRFGRYYSPTTSVNPGPKIVVLDAFTGGGAQADQLRTENHFNLNEVVSWTSGKHFLKAGFNVPDFSRRGSNDYTNFAGAFTFSTLQDYLARRPFSFVRQQGEGHLVFLEKLFGGFIQDDYRPRQNLSISAGLRYDWQNYFHDDNNFSPRMSFAYSPGKSRKVVLRGGAGFFYDRTGSGPISDLLRFNGQRLRRYVLLDPGYPDPLGGGVTFSAEPSSVVRLDPRAHLPYTIQYSLGIERQLAKSTTLTVSYLGARGISLFRSRDVNAPPPPDYLARPDAGFAVERQIESSGRLASQSLEVSLRGAVGKYFSGMIQYVRGRAYNNTGGVTSFPANNYDYSREWGRADFDQRHRFNLLGTLRPGKWLNLGMAVSLNSGAPYSLTTGRDDNHDGLALDRPAGVGRNTLTGPAYLGLDLRWSHDFFLTRAKKDKGPVVTAGVDAFNAVNTVNDASYVGNLSSPFFGHAVSARPARRVQLSMRFRF